PALHWSQQSAGNRLELRECDRLRCLRADAYRRPWLPQYALGVQCKWHLPGWHADTDAHSDSNTDAYPYSHGHTHCYGHSYADYTAGEADADPATARHTATPADAVRAGEKLKSEKLKRSLKVQRELAKAAFASFSFFAHRRGAFRRWLALVPGRDRAVAGIADPGEVVPRRPASPMPATTRCRLQPRPGIAL